MNMHAHLSHHMAAFIVVSSGDYVAQCIVVGEARAYGVAENRHFYIVAFARGKSSSAARCSHAVKKQGGDSTAGMAVWGRNNHLASISAGERIYNFLSSCRPSISRPSKVAAK